LANWFLPATTFKKEAIRVGLGAGIEVWNSRRQRLYATVTKSHQSKGDPSEFDQEAWNFWRKNAAASDSTPPSTSSTGNKKDKFWMMVTPARPAGASLKTEH